MFNVQSDEDFDRLEEFCRSRFSRASSLTITADRISAQDRKELASGIRDRLLDETVSLLRRSLRPDTVVDADQDGDVSISVPRGHLSNRLPMILREERQRIFGIASSPGPMRATFTSAPDGAEATNKPPVAQTLNWDPSEDAPLGPPGRPSDVTTWRISPSGALSFDCPGADPGGDEIGDQLSGMWDKVAADFGSPVPWKPVWHGPPDPDNPGNELPSWIIAVALDNAPFNWAKLTLENGAPDGVGAGQVLIGLANGTGWAKELWYWNSCVGNVIAVGQSGFNLSPNFARVDIDLPPYPPNPIPSMIFRKPGFLGIWHDVGHFPLFHTRFAEFFGGTKATFTWVVD